ncbi:hypothetical protein Cylst_5219 [Cylindrospermum stagnale PCC 7417]|uniref:Uncharacterized protein n=1 Tax=Cylindrospermum stagnale PCC 7417 TaxID=56107 RepID=K9X467_9NOST|nr:hypothetical protein [Cylindrospermum stagnale]AFZ27253.1 hypothetical protein Cylst_5219 [Cylindrospermum stagnale PCC 7417]
MQRLGSLDDGIQAGKCHSWEFKGAMVYPPPGSDRAPLDPAIK